MLQADSLTKTFGPRVAVERLSFDVRAGEIFALVGPNGAGKTTTLRMLAGLIRPSSGEVRFRGRPAAGGESALRASIGFLTEAPGLWDRLTVRQNLRVHARLHGLPRPDRAVDTALDLFGIADRASEPAAVLSKGLRQRVALARALLHDPGAVLLDEPTSGLDPESARDVRELVTRLRHERRAVLISTHNLDEVDRLADRVAVLNTRLVALDTPQSLRERAFGARVRIRFAGAGGRPRADAARRRARRRPRERRHAVDRSGRRRPAHARHRPPARRRRSGYRSRGARGAVARAGVPAAAGRRADVSGARVAALLGKELADLRGRPGLFFPAIFTGAMATLLPLFVTVLVPAFTGERLSDSADMQIALELYRQQPSARALDPEAAIQASLFQQFLVLLVLSPVAASMSIAAHSVIGEKQARTLEPLLATPITTFELLLAKILGAFLPALALSLACFAVYVGVAAALRAAGRGGGAAHAAAARRALPDGADGVADGADARRVRVVARQRRAQRAAAGRARRAADHGAAHRADRGRVRGDGAGHPADDRRDGRGERRPDPPGRVALRSGDDPHAMEMTAAGALNEFGRLTHVAVKHARDAFVSPEAIARQWASHGFTAAPDFDAACREHDAFLEILARHGVEPTLLPADAGTTIDSIYTRDASLVTPRGVVLCAMGKAARAGEPAAQGRDVHARQAGPGRRWPARSSRPDASRAATWCGSTTGRSPSAAATGPTPPASASSRRSSGPAWTSSRCRCRTGRGPAT